MRQGLTILLDSFRLLKARWLFWISVGVSILVALIFASIGFDEEGVSIFFGLKHVESELLRAGTDEAAAFYLLLFTDVIVKFWLAWIAILLALITTASLFPEFISSGTIGISLSKPISRLSLFLWKYVGGLLFVFLQVSFFSLIVFVAIGARLGEWNLSVFWAVPVVTFVFSLLYSVCVFIGVWTRSTLLGLLVGLFVWGGSLLTQCSEDTMYKMAYTMPEVGVTMDLEQGGLGVVNEGEPVIEELAEAHTWVKRVATPMPKTRDCTMYLKRLMKFKENDSFLSGMSLDMLLMGGSGMTDMRPAMRSFDERHSATYVFGTSLGFELVMMALAALIFCRRDY